MTSINNNASATTALRTLQATNAALETTQNRISTGLKIGEAKDNAAYWAISTTLKSDNKSLTTVKDALNLGAATVDTAYQGLNKTLEVLDEIKSKLTAATQDGLDRDTIQAEIAQLKQQLSSIASSSVLSGENWLSIDSSVAGFNAAKQVVSSFNRDANNSVSIGTITVDTSGIALYDANSDTTKSGILDAATALTTAAGKALSYGGTPKTGNTAAGGLAATTATGTAATTAKSTFTGTFAATTLDENDKLTLTYSTDGSTTDSTIVIQASDITTAKGFAVAGKISSLAELVLVTNNVLADNGVTTVSAVNNGGAFAIQNTKTGYNNTVEVSVFTGTDAAFGLSTLSVGAGSGGALTANGAAFAGETQSFILGGPATADGTIAFTLATGETLNIAVDFTGGVNTITEIGDAMVAAVAANSTLSSLVSLSNSAGTVTVTYLTSGDKGLATVTPAATGVSIATAISQATAYDSNAATDSLLWTSGTTLAFADDDDAVLFKFTDSELAGGAVQTVTITKTDLETAGITDGLLNSAADIKGALAAAFTRQSATTALFGNYTIGISSNDITLTRSGAGIAGQQISITNSLTAVDLTPSISTTLGLTAPTGVKRGTDATAAATSTTVSLPSGGIVLDTDDSISFDVKVGSNDVKTVTINQALVNTTLASATSAKVSFGTFDATGLASGNTIAFTVEWDGVASSYAITNLTETSTASDFVTAINAATVTAGAGTVGTTTFGASGTASVVDGKIVFTAIAAGSTKSIKVTSVSNTNAYAGSAGLTTSSLVTGENAVAAPAGTISTAAQYARVIDAALLAAGASGVKATNSAGVISLTSTATGATASVTVSDVIASAGANTISVAEIDISATGLAAVGADTADEIKAVLKAYIQVVNAAINKITSAAADMGSVASRIDLQSSFVDTLIDTIDEGVSKLIDADLSEESTRLQALQTKQQLGIQALSIANASTQNVLALFQ